MLFRTAFVLGTVCGKELAYMRARKDGGWDADCQTAFDGLRGVAFASADADVERSGDGVVFSAAGQSEFARREVLPAAAIVAALRADATWPSSVRVALFAEAGLLRRKALGVPVAGERFLGAFDLVLTLEREAERAYSRLVAPPNSPPAFRVKAAKILAMIRSPFERTVYLDFDSRPCVADFAARLLRVLGDADLALADNYEGQGALAPAEHYEREHASGCVVLRSGSARVRALLSLYLEAFVALRHTVRGRRDQPALMVALRSAARARAIVEATIDPDAFCRKNTSKTVSCGGASSCIVAHKTAKYDTGFKIFGVGFKKTGTTSLAAALQTLKIAPEPSHGESVAATLALLREPADAGPAVAAATSARAFADAPWCMAGSRGSLLERLAVAYPRAKFVLTLRDPEAWWRSTSNWLACLKPFNVERYTRMLGAANFSKPAFVHAYEAYNHRVIHYFDRANEPHRLLTVDLTTGSFPWTQLCAFVEAWGRCPTDTPLKANAFLENDFSKAHAQAAPSSAELADCAAQRRYDATAVARHAEGRRGAEDRKLAKRRAERDAIVTPT